MEEGGDELDAFLASPVWQEFYRQDPALAALDRAPADRVIMSLMRDDKGNNMYTVSTVQAAYQVMMGRGLHQPRGIERIAIGEHMFELTIPDRRMRPVVDADVDAALNKDFDGELALRNFIFFAEEAHREAGLPVPIFDIECSHKVDAITRVMVVKWSYHLKLKAESGHLLNMDEMRAWLERILTIVKAAYTQTIDTERHARAASLVVYRYYKVNGLKQEWFPDTHIYSCHRVIRMLGASKFPRPGEAKRYLLYPGMQSRDEITLEQWDKSRIMNIGTGPLLVLPPAWLIVKEKKDRIVDYSESSMTEMRRLVKERNLLLTTPTRVMSEPDRIAYFQNHYPVDLIARLWHHPGQRMGMVQGIDGRGEVFRKWIKTETMGLTRNLRTFMCDHNPGALSLHAGQAITHVTTAPESGLVTHMTQRELVIDLDLDAWNVRDLLCGCKEKMMCDICWLFIEMASEVCRWLLTGLYKLGDMLAVYSGGRGCHLWWGAPHARVLTNRELHLIADTLFAYPLTPERVNPDLLKAGAVAIKGVWETRGIQQRALLADAHIPNTPGYRLWQKMLTYGPASVVHQPGLSPQERSQRCWDAWFTGPTHEDARMRFFIEMGWPRLDTQVTVRKNQSLRMPFSIHSSTGRISLPLNSIQAQQPRDMPLVQQVLKGEVDAMRQWNIGLAALEVWLNSCGYRQA